MSSKNQLYKPGGAVVETLEQRWLLSASTVGIYVSQPYASESDASSSGRGEFFIKRTTGSTSQSLPVKYYVHGTSTASSGSDFKPLTGYAVIPAGQRSVSIKLEAIDDSAQEARESVALKLIRSDKYSIANPGTTLLIADNDARWWKSAWDYRTTVSVDVGSAARTNLPVNYSISFTEILDSLGRSGSLVESSIRVIEVGADQKKLINTNVPFQFDKASGYNASSDASGTLVFQLPGTTAAGKTRYFHVYFDTTGTFAAPSFTSQVGVSDGVTDEGFESIRITTPIATYFYQKGQGGFSSILDANGNDWINWNANTDPGSAGEYRGIPNLGPAGFHPGRNPTQADDTSPDTLHTEVISSGPLKTVIESRAHDTGNKVRWEFYATFARMTVLSFDRPYYFLYEGTPGGSMSAGDTIVRSDGTVTSKDQQWDDTDGIGSGNGQEWAYFRDSAVGAGGRYMFFVHDTPDNLEDSYYNLDDNMTVFGFGRRNHDFAGPEKLMTAAPNRFTVGIADGGGNFATASATINGAYRAVTTAAGLSLVRSG